MNELLPCPFCGGEAEYLEENRLYCRDCGTSSGFHKTEAEAIKAWNTRAAVEFDNWFYLPKPKDAIVEVTETTHGWCGNKVKTDIFYHVQEQAIINWAKELDEHIIKRICEVWNPKRTCHVGKSDFVGDMYAFEHEFHCDCGLEELYTTDPQPPNYCPNCGAKVEQYAR